MKAFLLDENAIKQRLQALFNKRRLIWLTQSQLNEQWPLTIALGIPDQKTALANQQMVVAWIRQWQQWQGAGQLHWCQRDWSMLGQQQLPEKIIFSQPVEIARWLGQEALWQQMCVRYQQLITQWPLLAHQATKYQDALIQYSPEDFTHLQNVLTWLLQYPHSQLYLRQLPISGIDTKWMEAHKKIVFVLLKILKNRINSSEDFYATAGLKREPHLIRLRILDAVLRRQIHGLSDLAVTVAELADLKFTPQRIYIVENLRTGLAFTDLAGAVVFIGLGYAVDQLRHIPWIHLADYCYYWGDLDTHGFAILNRARRYFPHLKSLFMDQETLFKAKVFWVQENKPCRAEDLQYLLPAEEEVYTNLCNNTWGYQIRLEQERLFWPEVWQSLMQIK